MIVPEFAEKVPFWLSENSQIVIISAKGLLETEHKRLFWFELDKDGLFAQTG